MSNKRRGHKARQKPKPPSTIKFSRQGDHKSGLVDSNTERVSLDNSRLAQRLNKERHNEHQGNANASKKRGGDQGRLLTDPKSTKEDIQLIERAIRNKWGVRRKNTIQRRLLKIVEKESVPVLTKYGPFQSEADADAHAVAAARVLVAMNAQDQADDYEEAKSKQQQPGTTVNINVDSNRSRLLELAHKFGARELVIDGRAIPTNQEVGRVVQAGGGTSKQPSP